MRRKEGMIRYCVIAFLVVGSLACRPHAQMVRLSVSDQQQKNFEAFLLWVRQHPSLKDNDGLIAAHRSAFTALKNNDAQAYFAALDRLDAAAASVTHQEDRDIFNFFSTLPSARGSLRPDEGNGDGGRCQVACLFGSCTIECPPGTKPSCSCQKGFPRCACEPY